MKMMSLKVNGAALVSNLLASGKQHCSKLPGCGPGKGQSHKVEGNLLKFFKQASPVRKFMFHNALDVTWGCSRYCLTA